MDKIEVRCRGEYSEVLTIGQTLCTLEENGDLNAFGSVKVADNLPKKYRKVRIYANLCDESGNVRYIINSWINVSIDVNVYFSFSMYCANINRFFDAAELKYIEIFPMFNEKDL